MQVPAELPLYWRVYGADPIGQPGRSQQSQQFSFTREGLHLLGPGDLSVFSAPPAMEWTTGCSENTSWIIGMSTDPEFNDFTAISPVLESTSWIMEDTIWDTLPPGIPIYWKVLGYHQPVPWRVLFDWSQDEWALTKSE